MIRTTVCIVVQPSPFPGLVQWVSLKEVRVLRLLQFRSGMRLDTMESLPNIYSFLSYFKTLPASFGTTPA